MVDPAVIERLRIRFGLTKIQADEAIADLFPRVGMGQTEILSDAANVEAVKAAREAISPWLWILSIIGFGMTVMNTRRIARMYHVWKGRRRAA